MFVLVPDVTPQNMASLSDSAKNNEETRLAVRAVTGKNIKAPNFCRTEIKRLYFEILYNNLPGYIIYYTTRHI